MKRSVFDSRESIGTNGKSSASRVNLKTNTHFTQTLRKTKRLDCLDFFYFVVFLCYFSDNQGV